LRLEASGEPIDAGLPSYNQTRAHPGLDPALSFEDIASDTRVSQRLRAAYSSVDAVDLWVGGLAEDHIPGAMVGDVFFALLQEQFYALREGDRFWYREIFTPEAVRELEHTRLADIIRRNTGIGSEISDDVFRVNGNTAGTAAGRAPRDQPSRP
jgi:peroxidase